MIGDMTSPLAEYRARQDPPMRAAQLAKKLGISRSFLARLESGDRKPSIELVKRISDELGIAPAELRPDRAAEAAIFSEAAQ